MKKMRTDETTLVSYRVFDAFDAWSYTYNNTGAFIVS